MEALINGDVVLDLDIVADPHFWSDHNILANINVLSKAHISEDVAEVPNFAAFTDFHAWINIG
jgi:hypothetical protein